MTRVRAFSTTGLMELRWRRAPADLRPFVTAFFERQDATGFRDMRELPVPAPLLQIMIGGDVRLIQGALPVTAPRAALWGPSSCALFSQTTAPLHAFVAVLTLRGAAVLAGTAEGLADRRAPLDDLLPPGARTWPERIAGAAHIDDRVDLAEAGLRALIPVEEPRPVDPALSVVDAMLQHRLRGPVAAIARRCGVSERALHKRCDRLLGWSPKRVLRIARLQRLLRTLHPSPWLDADTDDARLEYADDSHLAHDLMDLTGLTVTAYRASKLASGDRLVHTLI